LFWLTIASSKHPDKAQSLPLASAALFKPSVRAIHIEPIVKPAFNLAQVNICEAVEKHCKGEGRGDCY